MQLLETETTVAVKESATTVEKRTILRETVPRRKEAIMPMVESALVVGVSVFVVIVERRTMMKVNAGRSVMI